MWKGNRHVGMPSGTPVESNATLEINLKEYITDIHDYPKKGVIFRDITPLLLHPGMLRYAIDLMTKGNRHQDIELVVALEARGFLFGPAIATKLGAGFVPIRKAGKLPRETLRAYAELEYGLVEIELHQDAILKGQKTLLVDDVLATGGTAKAAIELIKSLGGEVAGAQFLIELGSLGGREKLDIPVQSVIHY
jgi:adenine phosphoribosyltransferase